MAHLQTIHTGRYEACYGIIPDGDGPMLVVTSTDVGGLMLRGMEAKAWADEILDSLGSTESDQVCRELFLLNTSE